MPQPSHAGEGARIIIDQSKIRVVDDLVRRGAPGFPRSLDWWRRNVPDWLDVAEDEHGRIILEPNGYRADGVVLEVTPALCRRRLRYARNWMDNQIFLDFSDAIVTGGAEAGAR